MQKVRSSDFTCFSSLGLGITLGLCTLIIIASFAAPPAVQSALFKDAFRRHQALEWELNDKFHLQRLAHEELGFGSWSLQNGIPITEAGDVLAVLEHGGEASKLPKLKSKEEVTAPVDLGVRETREGVAPVGEPGTYLPGTKCVVTVKYDHTASTLLVLRYLWLSFIDFGPRHSGKLDQADGSRADSTAEDSQATIGRSVGLVLSMRSDEETDLSLPSMEENQSEAARSAEAREKTGSSTAQEETNVPLEHVGVSRRELEGPSGNFLRL
jgi:hypothetical protein